MKQLNIGRFRLNKKIFILLIVVFLAGIVLYSLASPKKNDSTKSDSQTAQFTDETIQQASEKQVANTSIVFVPDTISEADKKALKTKLVQPYVDYKLQYKENNTYNPATTIKITKISDADYTAQQEVKFRYVIDVTLKNDGKEQFLYGQDGNIDWLLPSCQDQECHLTDAYKSKYPEIVAKLQARGDQP